MKQISRRLVLLMAALITGLNAGGQAQPAQTEAVEVPTDHKVFIYGSGGMSYWDVEANPDTESSYNSGALDDSGSVLEVGIGYEWNEKLFSTLSYQKAELDLATIDLLFVSLNYKLGDSDFKPYVGVILGYSKLTWDEPSDTVHTVNQPESEAIAYGLQVGASKSVSDNLSVFGKYEIIFNDHLTEIYTPEPIKSIKHQSVQNLIVGVQYAF